jgi:ribosome-associated translation inhibitor RaiA
VVAVPVPETHLQDMVATNMGKRGAANGQASTPLAFEFHSQDFPVPEDVVRYTENKIAARLQKFGNRVLGVVVHVKDINGNRGGEGLVCHMEARLARLEPVNVEERDDDLREAIDLALDRMESAVARHVGRARSLPRHKGGKSARDSKLAR